MQLLCEIANMALGLYINLFKTWTDCKEFTVPISSIGQKVVTAGETEKADYQGA